MRDIWFESGGTRLFAMEDGDGPVIVMLHGGMADPRAALPLVASLRDSYHVVVPDLRGSGRSWSAQPLTFERLADDVDALLDHLEANSAVVGGVSSGSGVALKFALRRPSRLDGLVIVTPVYAGEERGYTEQQRETFEMMDALASRAVDEGVRVLRPLYENLPSHIREQALAKLDEFDAPSVVATSHFIASGAQPFGATVALRSLDVPTLLVRGDDPVHTGEISDVYENNIPNCSTLPASTEDTVAAIGSFYDEVVSAKSEGV